jgi:hypothetical protein
MNTDLLTEKAREAIVAAEQLAEERRNSQLEPEHLLQARRNTARATVAPPRPDATSIAGDPAVS